MKAYACLGDNALYGFTVHNQVISSLLENLQIVLVLQNRANRCLVQHTVSLSTGCSDSRSLACVEDPELNTATISSTCHGAIERIDLFDQMAFADTADGRVAGHLSKGLDVMGQQQCLGTDASRRQRSLRTGMTATNYDYIKVVRVIH